MTSHDSNDPIAQQMKTHMTACLAKRGANRGANRGVWIEGKSA